MRSTNWNFAVPLVKPEYSGTQAASVSSDVSSAVHGGAGGRSPHASVTRPPATGSQMTRRASRIAACL